MSKMNIEITIYLYYIYIILKGKDISRRDDWPFARRLKVIPDTRQNNTTNNKVTYKINGGFIYENRRNWLRKYRKLLSYSVLSGKR